MTTVKELRDTLEGCGYDADDLKDMKKADLLGAVAEAQGDVEEAVTGLSEVDEAEDNSMYADGPPETDTEVAANNVSPGDPDWTQFLLSELYDDELAQTDDGDPVVKVNGLRRLTEKHLGNILDQDVGVVQAPNADNQWTATVVVAITIEKHNGNVFRMSDAADCSIINSDKKFSKFPTSMATTRAEARVLRKALKINVVSEEEMLDNDDVDFDNAGSILEPQVHMINAMCSRIGVNTREFVGLGKRKLNDIADATQREAANMIQVLNEYQQNTSKIPEEIKE